MTYQGGIASSALGPNSSYSWRSLWSSKALVKEGMLWRVGDGCNINVWNDPWLIDDESRFSTTIERTSTYSTVAELMDKENCCRDLGKIESIFNDRDRQAILAIPLSERMPKDTLSWAWSKDGSYTVRTAYILGTSLELDNFEHFWVELWKTKTTLKVRHFLWRCCSKSLPTRSTLEHRHLIEDSTCPCCGSLRETINHAVVLCPSANQLWVRSGCDEALKFATHDSFGETLLGWAKNLSAEVYQRSLFLSWFMWFRRNKWIFEREWEADESLLLKHSRLVADFGEYTERIYGGIPSTAEPAGNSVWVPPPPGVFKINVDAALLTEGRVGLGAIARDSRGQVLFSAVRRVRANWEPLVAESKAAWFGVKKAKDQGLRDVILETDSLLLASKLKKKTFSFAAVDSILEDIIYASLSFSSIFWSHVKRDGNYAAHHLARIVPYGSEQSWEYLVPNEISPYVLMDNLSMN